MNDICTLRAACGEAKVVVKSQTEHLQSWWRRGQFYEQEMLEWIQEHYSGGVFIDVGSSIGNHTLFFSRFCKPSSVISVEPVLSSLSHQEENLALNGVGDRVRTFQLAVSDVPGQGRMEKQPGDNVGMYQLVEGDEVCVTTLDDLVEALDEVTLVKLDVEWHEVQALKGARKLLEEKRPVLFVEAASEQVYQDIVGFLQEFGYWPRRRFNASPTYEFLPRPVVSVCMIVKDEEGIIREAIESAEGLADEVVVVDTGSTDGTLALLDKLGAQVTVGGDRMHKGESRNAAQDAARGDWVVILDADERIVDPVGLRRFLTETEAQAVYIRLAFMDGKDQPTLTYPQMRCWRKGTFEYKYRAHEVPVPTDGWGRIVHTDFVWEHRPPPGRIWKSEYTLNRLLLDVEENPGVARPLYYLGRQYMYRQEWGKGIETLEEYLKLQGHTDRADAWHCIAKCHGGLGNEKEQIGALYRACAEQPLRRDWWGALASIYHRRGQDDVAVGLLKCALEISLPERGYATHFWHGPHIYDLLARCLWKLRRYEEGRHFAQKALDLSPEDKRLRDNLRWFVDKLRD